MSEDSVIGMPVPGAVSDPLTELLRAGAKTLIAQAVEAELAELLEQYAEVRDGHGRQAVVRNGYQPERQVVTGIGPVAVRGWCFARPWCRPMCAGLSVWRPRCPGCI